MRLSQNNYSAHINLAVCFYGSQIRFHTTIIPCFNVPLVFPKRASHFDVSALLAKLENKNNMEITQVVYFYGFMNFNSDYYNEVGYIRSMDVLRLTAT